MPESTAQLSQADAATLDDASLQRLRDLDPDGTSQVVRRVLQAFDGSLQRLLPQGEQAFAQGDHQALRHVVHTLKSSSASVGALELSRRCGDMENRLRTLQDDDISELWHELQHEGRRVLLAVQAMLSA
jgi:HPt (histidine-containing phosphotransfer) domain-containing protein